MTQIKCRGFTLIETLIALMIVAGGLLALVTTWQQSALSLQKSQRQFELQVLLEKKINETDFKYRNRPISAIPDEDSGDFGENYPNYTWQLRAKKMEFPDLTRLLRPESSQVSSEMQILAQEMQKLFNQAVKEVEISVSYQGKGKAITQSISFLMVDHQFLSGLSSFGGTGGQPSASGPFPSNNANPNPFPGRGGP